MMDFMKPISRSKLRIALGKIIYTILRYLKWFFDENHYVKRNGSEIILENEIFTHSTPLIRELSGLSKSLQYNKIENLSISIKKLDGIHLKPGETFSFWKLVGRPTKKKGYKKGLVLKSGGLSEGIGGGLCQLTNLIYWMTLHTPLDVIERFRHSYDVFPDSNRTQPFGSGATCVYNYRDLVIQNNTNQTFQLKLSIDNKSLIGAWRADEKTALYYEIYEKKHWMRREFWGGYIRHNIISRKVYDIDGNQLLDEDVAENHALMMYQPFISESACNEDEKIEYQANC